ncbi:uncharacterized protein BJ171DRAFT_139061 [Polychytrium aggregatum]|uniref:uncharacterized protein n=1 Tax=Polychytrium aggregatum TaxID=110093 RepID=UPI0022FE0C07|nr:uncharacterized protein BJ171DRAFT_139061 [Polychytrium aggregatum]KAI9203701.1 hypothetical protein BJ171DRAFT_139061 [Polychytrium aggregatum]
MTNPNKHRCEYTDLAGMPCEVFEQITQYLALGDLLRLRQCSAQLACQVLSVGASYISSYPIRWAGSLQVLRHQIDPLADSICRQLRRMKRALSSQSISSETLVADPRSRYRFPGPFRPRIVVPERRTTLTKVVLIRELSAPTTLPASATTPRSPDKGPAPGFQCAISLSFVLATESELEPMVVRIKTLACTSVPMESFLTELRGHAIYFDGSEGRSDAESHIQTLVAGKMLRRVVDGAVGVHPEADDRDSYITADPLHEQRYRLMTLFGAKCIAIEGREDSISAVQFHQADLDTGTDTDGDASTQGSYLHRVLLRLLHGLVARLDSIYSDTKAGDMHPLAAV